MSRHSDQTLRDALKTDGAVWLRGAATGDDVRALESTLAGIGKPGARVPIAGPLGAAIGTADFLRRLRSAWPGMRPVRIVSFDKRPGVNWGVSWHQDRIIAVKERADSPGYTNWSRKSGVWHCEPPLDLLQRMLFVRVHFDSNTARNGAMEIARGSHVAGKVLTEDAPAIAGRFDTELTEAAAGDVLVLNMLTLHRSLPSRADAPRRVLRIDLSPDTLPPPLEWAE